MPLLSLRIRAIWSGHSFRPLVAVVASMVLVACGADPPVEPPAEAAASAEGGSGVARVSGTAPPANGGIVSIVLLDPHADIEVPLPDEVPIMDQYGRQFVPTFLLVRQGQTINFTNSEDDLHTVHVKDSDGESLINVATLNGSSYEFTIEQAGAYKVVCNTHTEMEADILAVNSPYAVVADPDGAFTVPSVVPGTYTVTVLHGADRREQDVEIVAGANTLNLVGL